METSRRRLLLLAGLAGGVVAAEKVAAALQLVPDLGRAVPLQLVRPRQPRHVVVLGGGISGLVAAFELQRAGYSVEVLEAAHRLGGRVLTLRRGDVVDEIGNRQVCAFDDAPHLYFNAGASRIPSTHARLLGYCAELGVALETHVNANPSALLQYDGFQGGRPLRQREDAADARGFVAELLSKAVSGPALEAPLSAADRERLAEFLVQFGDLEKDRVYRGSGSRAGYQVGGLYEAGTRKPVIDLSALLSTDYWKSALNFGESESQSAMLQPVGGMDRIVTALASRLAGRIRLQSQVLSIRTGEQGVEVHYRRGGQVQQVRADYCLDSIPAQLLAGIDNNFSTSLQRLLPQRPRGKIGKIALQMRERFWEREGIYGGISWTGAGIGQIQYPSHGFHARKGVLLGGYYLGQDSVDAFHLASAEERLKAAIADGEKLHPGYGSQVENGISVAWHRMNHHLGCTARDTDAQTLGVLRRPEGRHFLMGDQVSAHAGWQEAAVLSAHDTLLRIDAMERAS